ncbi:MAG: hypothetical protein GY827_01415 [Cytophagales bacterium]|nr:hypothetical protein [Cytophagales bacterium]
MANLFGGKQLTEQELASMEKQLLHRGSEKNSTIFLNNYAIQVNQQSFNDTLHKVSTGSHQGENQAIAVAGYIHNEQYKLLSPSSLFKSFQQKGLDFLQEIRGSFVMVIIDGETIHLVRDGAGRKTIFYAKQGNLFNFAIEPKALSQFNRFERKINHASIVKYFSFSFIPERDTMLEDIFELKPNTIVSYHPQKGISEQHYLNLDNVEKHHIDDLEYWKQDLSTEMQKDVQFLLKNTNDKVGVFLSGGLDSSIISAIVAQESQKTIPTYSIHFGEEYRNELDFARMVADRYQTDHHEVKVDPNNFLPKLFKTIWHLDDPIGDPITVPNFELAQFASKKCNYIFNGEGGDPCFGGPKNIPMMVQEWYGTSKEENYREKAYLNSYQRGYAYMDKFLQPKVLNSLNHSTELEGILTPFFNTDQPSNYLDKLMNINIQLKGAHLILPKVERMLGASQITPLSPMFTENVIRKSMEMPSLYKLNQGVEKYILKKAYWEDIPREIINRPKSGMRVPVQYWFQKEMKKYAKKVLLNKSFKETGLFNQETIREILAYDFERGIRRHGLLLWMILTFEIWRKIFIENEEF